MGHEATEIVKLRAMTPPDYSDRDQLLTALDALPKDDATYAFDLQATSLASELPDAAEETLARIAADASQPTELRYGALYALATRLRRAKCLQELAALLSEYRASDLGDFPSFAHLESLCASSDSRQVRDALMFARMAAAQMPEHAGVLHHLAATIVRIEMDGATADPAVIQEARQMVDRAIALTGGRYPKYFATLAQVLALAGDFDGANLAIERAIAHEPRGGVEYALRVSEYMTVRTDIAFRVNMSRMAAQDAEAEAKIAGLAERLEATVEEVRRQSVEFIGILTAIIAFVVTGAQVALGADTFAQGGRLYLLIGGVLVILLGLGGWLIGDQNRAQARRVGVTIALGLFLIVISTAAWSWLT